MKRIIPVLAVFVMLLMLAACSSGVSDEAYEAAMQSIADLRAQNEELQAQLDELTNEYQAVLAQSATQEIETASEEMKTDPESPWFSPLPEGISADVQISEDKMTMYVVYTNNTGEAVSIGTSYAFADKDLNPIMEGATGCMYVGDGCKYIAVLDSWDPIEAYILDCQLDRVYKAIREANKGIWIDSYRNSDGSVSATFHSTEDSASLNGNVFFLDEDGTVLGYQWFGLGGMMPMDETFYAPDYDYADYLICCEAMG